MATGYSLSTQYSGQGLLDSFNFFTGNDPNHGFVDYQNKENAIANNLVSVDDEYNSVRLGVDSDSIFSTSDIGRPSVRLTSQDSFTHGLFIADISHMPASTCGTWPSFWAFNNQDNGTNWPEGGEIEIIEGANTAQRNLYSAHTTAGCQAPGSGFSGEQHSLDCSKSPENIGCNYASPISDTTSYGDSFNAEGGGVYALEWDSDALKIWHFPRSTIPDNIVYGHVEGPDPSTWGPPQAIFGGSSCDADTYFSNMSLVFNINFCGDYAGNVWGKADQCHLLAPTCEEFVAGNPSSFSEAYWDINFIDVYQIGPLTNTTIPPLSQNVISSTSITAPSTTAIPENATPTHTRTVKLSLAQPTPTGNNLVERTPVGGFTLMGCFKSSTSSQSFSKLTLPSLGNEACVASCGDSKYAGVHNSTCYCADNIGDAIAVDIGLCDIPCPQGGSEETCGGHIDEELSSLESANSTLPSNSSLQARTTSRMDTANVLLTVYGNLSAEPMPPGAPAMGGCPVNTKINNTYPMPSTTTTEDVMVTAVAVQTVVPIIGNPITSVQGTAASSPSKAATSFTTPYAAPQPSVNSMMPLAAGAAPLDKAASALWTLGWGLALWFVVFGVMATV